jgi:hypothetical protein
MTRKEGSTADCEECLKWDERLSAACYFLRFLLPNPERESERRNDASNKSRDPASGCNALRPHGREHWTRPAPAFAPARSGLGFKNVLEMKQQRSSIHYHYARYDAQAIGTVVSMV